jgi:hypothetical protein
MNKDNQLTLRQAIAERGRRTTVVVTIRRLAIVPGRFRRLDDVSRAGMDVDPLAVLRTSLVLHQREVGKTREVREAQQQHDEHFANPAKCA